MAGSIRGISGVSSFPSGIHFSSELTRMLDAAKDATHAMEDGAIARNSINVRKRRSFGVISFPREGSSPEYFQLTLKKRGRERPIGKKLIWSEFIAKVRAVLKGLR